MFTISEIENNLVGLSHGGTLNKVRNKYHLYFRAANNLLSKIKPLETIRVATLAQTVHSDFYEYGLPSDYSSLIGIYPQANRNLSDQPSRVFAEAFDRRRSIDNKMYSIEAVDGVKKARINWAVRQPKVLSTMESYNGNGTWSAVGTASNVATDTIYKYAGSGSVRFDTAASGDGIQNTTLNALDLTDEDEVANAYVPFFIKDTTELAKITSATLIWGNDVTTKYWTGVAVTAQADGTAFRVGWNTIKVPWSTATETGTVDPALIDSAKITFASTSGMNDIRVDNIMFSIGYPFDIKYQSKYLFQTAAGVYINQPTTDTDVVVLDNDAINIFLYECLDEMAHQTEGEDSSFDMAQANKKLYGDPRASDYVGRVGLYAAYRSEYPAQTKKVTANYGLKPRFNRI